MKRILGCGKLFGWLALAMGTVLLTPTLRADGAGPAQAARLSYVEGQVRISQGGQVIADGAVANTPLFEGAQLVTGDDGKAEIQLDDGSVARISPDSSATLTVLRGTGETEIVLTRGLAYFELQGSAGAAQFRVRFGNSLVTASGLTLLRVRMDTPPGEIAVFSGNAQLERGSALALSLHGGESAVLNGADPSRYNLAETIEPDSWDTWNSDRDQALTAEAASTTGAAGDFANSDNQNPAWNDLDANGNWYNVPGEGYVWSPYEASNSGWDPYGSGSWTWTPGYGYIWASSYSWGYMPYQCGMWNYYDNFGWGWAPGMGRCGGWWGGGYYGGINIGRTPHGYNPIRRPITPGRIGGGPRPVIAIDRRHTGAPGGSLPPRDRNTPVTIGGHTVQAIRPQPQPLHEGYGQPGAGFVGGGSSMPNHGVRTPGGQPNGGRPVYNNSNMGGSAPIRNSGSPTYGMPNRTPQSGRQNYTAPSRSTPQPSQNYMVPNRSNPQPSHSPSGGGQPSRPSGGSPSGGGGVPHSGGGGGGGAPHSSGGGGGNGGGGSHSSGGGSGPHR